MKLITCCNQPENPNFQLLVKSAQANGAYLVNTFPMGQPWGGFFARWEHIRRELEQTPPTEPVAVIDGLDVFVLGSLATVPNRVWDDVILFGRHAAPQYYCMPNTCNRNAGVLIGTAGTMLRVAKILESTSFEHRAFVSDCDQTYLNYCLNNTDTFQGITFEHTDIIYMNEPVCPPENAVFYHAVGMHDVYNRRTRAILRDYFDFELTATFNRTRWFRYLWKWVRNEVACRMVAVGALLRHLLTVMACG